MTSERRVVVVTAGYGGGHEYIAAALATMLRARSDSDVRVAEVDLLERCAPRAARLAKIAYGAGEGFFPGGSGDLAALARTDSGDPTLRELIAGGIATAEATLGPLRPDAVLAVHAVAGAIAAECGERLGYGVATVMPDLALGRAWVHPGCAMWFVPTPEVRDGLVLRGVQWDSIVVSGVPVPGGTDGVAAAQPRSALGAERRFTAAVLDSGRADARGVVQALSGSGIQVVTTLAYADAAARSAAPNASVRTVSPSTVPTDLAAAADILVAGPCGAAQWVGPAAGKPVIVVEPVVGMESASVRLMVAAGAALVAHDAEEAAAHAAYLSRHPDRFESMCADAGRLGRSNATRIVCERFLAHLG